jgi:hypothetical protein
MSSREINTRMVKVHNPTKKAICVWWGTDAYMAPAGDTTEMPSIVAKESLGHKDYKELKIVEDKPVEEKETVTLNLDDEDDDE